MTATDQGQLLPRYYLTHSTPAGDRFAYPAPKVAEDRWPAVTAVTAVTWSTEDGATVQAGRGGGWLVADRPLTTLTGSWLPTTRLAGWLRRKGDTAPTDPIEQRMWELAPDQPSPDMVKHYDRHDCDGCLQCLTLITCYTREIYQPPAESETFDLSGWVPLPGEPDPDPHRDWMVDDVSRLAVYGLHTAHLWPGQLPGFRRHVYELLDKDPRVKYVFDAARHNDQPRGTLQTTVQILWETPRETMRNRTGARGQGLRGKVAVPQPIAHSARTTLAVPEGLHAPSKAAAIERWPLAVAEYLTRLVPVDVVACDRCDGHGHLLRGDDKEGQR